MALRTIPATVGALLALAASAAAATPSPPAVPPERALYADGPSGRYLLDAGWSTRPDPRDVGLARGWSRPGLAAGFRAVTVPHAFNAGDLSKRGFRSRVQWYRTTFAAPDAPGTTGWALRFEGVNRRADVWLNGERLGAHDGGYAPFELRADQLHPGANELVVRVDGRMSDAGLPPASRPRGWWNYGGILREVYLRRLTGFDVERLDVAATPADPAPLRLRAHVRNTSAAPAQLAWELELTGPDGLRSLVAGDAGTVAAGAGADLEATVEVPSPRLWSPADPALYEARLRVSGGQQRVTHVGIRAWSVEGGRVRLNGAPLVLRGASFHEETAAHGAALTDADRAGIVADLRALGANMARAHYPPHPALLEAFDRLGIAYWEQIPVWRLSGAELRGPLRRAALDLLRETVTRDRQHASVMAWSVSNETLRGGAAERRYLRDAAALVRDLDPTRLVSADASLRPLADLPAALRQLDAVGVNEYVGWYGGTLPGDLRADLRALRRRYPAQALLVTEFGAEANRAGPVSAKGTYAFQRRFLDRTLAVLDATPWLSGALVWALRDFPVRPGWDGGNPRPSPPINHKGVYSRTGTAKPAATAVRRRFGDATRSTPAGVPSGARE